MKETLEGVSMEIPMKCDGTVCSLRCPLYSKGSCERRLSAEVQRLRDERENNPGVWDKAPKNANKANVIFMAMDDPVGTPSVGFESYTRELPKTIEQEIAEKWGADKAQQSDILGALAEYKERTK